MSDGLSETSTKQELEDLLLYASRHGDSRMVAELLAAKEKKSVEFDISCKGKTKSNLGWTPLHLATYFGHEGVVELLLKGGCDVNAINNAGDTSLHKAAFIGREDIVLLLLQYNASVSISNGEGRKACDVARAESDVHKLLSAALAADIRRKEERLLTASRENDLSTIRQLLKDPEPPAINCIDGQGNSGLHCAAYRGHKEVAVLLLQNGIDTSIRNNSGQLAVDLARTTQMQQVLNVKPVKVLQKTADRFEGQLLKRSRFLGWKPVWAVLERGVLTYFNCRGDGSTGLKRKDFKYLDGANVTPLEHDTCTFIIHFSDTAVHRLSVVDYSDVASAGLIERQKWINALNEHIAYNNHYMCHGQVLYDSDEEQEAIENLKPLGSMKESLQDATAHKQLLEKHLKESEMLIRAMGSNSFVHNEAILKTVHKRFHDLYETSSDMVSSLNHCLTLFTQQEELRVIQLKQEQEKCRVLEEALNVLAKEHHELEQSLASQVTGGHKVKTRSPRFYDTSDDEFYDAFEADSDSDTLVSLRTCNDNSPVQSNLSRASSCSTLVSFGDHSYISAKDVPTLIQNSCWDRPGSFGKVLSNESSGEPKSGFIRYQYSENRIRMAVCQEIVEEKKHRVQLPVPMFSRNDFSVWSVLKNCIGKELSKITMPVIFNEPLSFLQRMVEYMEYAVLLKKASEQSDPVDRMKYVAAFAVSALASNWERLGKPFNPLLGETYELQRSEFRIICEQVSHHPPVSAFHADSNNFIFHGSIHPKLRFWGKSVEIQPKGMVTVELPRWGEAYTWTNVNCCVHNIIVGKLWIEQYGTMEVINHNTGHRAVLTFKPAGWFSKDLHRVEGFIMDKSKKKIKFLYGKWTDFVRCTEYTHFEEYYKENAHKFRRGDEKIGHESPAHTPKKVLAKLNSLKMSVSFKSQNSQAEEEGPPDIGEGDIPKCDSAYSIDIPHSETLWEAEPRPGNCSDYYQFTNFAMTLNEIDDDLKKQLCPTDSRLRPDIRKLELGDIDGAAAEKTRLEEKQRDARKSRKGKKSEEWTPRWFTQGPNPHTRTDDWLYSGGYWDREFSDIEDIF